MKSEVKIITFLSLFIFCLSFLLPGFLFPSDSLNYLPSFSQDSWVKPHNSLLADPVYQFEPWRHYIKELIQRGELPLWNNLNGAGVPLFANPIASTAFPLQVLYYILPLNAASWMIPLYKLLIFSVFSYFYLRILNCSRTISTIVTIGIVFSSYFMTWLLWPQTNVFIFLPLVLLITELLLRSKYPKHRLYVILSIVYMCVVLGGHPGNIVHLLFVHFTYAIFRLGKKKFVIPKILISACLGFTLASLQLLPWLEFMLRTTAFHQRFLSDNLVSIPSQSIFMNFFPVIFGAPHHEFYKQLSANYNFQESVAGYVTPLVLLTIFFGFGIIRKSNLARIWLGISLITYLIGFNIWPFSLIGNLPPLSGVSNLRLIAFGAFGLYVLFALILEKTRLSNFTLPRKYFDNFVVLTALFLFLIFAFEDIFSRVVLQILPDKLDAPYQYLKVHLLLMFYSLLAYAGVILFILSKKKRRQSKILYGSLIIPLLAQGLFLFWNYTPVVKESQYYPITELVKRLKALPEGTILEVGNPNIPANVNLVYGLKLAEDDYAVNVMSYKFAFDKAFPVKNHWNKVDSITPEALKRFGVNYIVSDYNINLEKIAVQKDFSTLLPPVANTGSIEIPFSAKHSKLRQIRLLTANYNRINTCYIVVSLINQEKFSEATQTIDCRDIRDKMFYSVSFPETYLIVGEEYKISIKSINSYKGNRISLWGNNKGLPFLETLYDTDMHNYSLLWNKKSVYVWGFQESKYITFPGEVDLLEESSDRTILNVNSKKSSNLEIKRINYPGWNAYINGKKVNLEKAKLFMSVSVPGGKNIVEFLYEPCSFYVGVIISFLTGIGLLIFMVKQELKEDYSKELNKKWILFAKRHNAQWYHHVLIVMLMFLISFTILSLLLSLIPIRFVAEKSTAINWFVTHNYPRQQDFYYFFFGFGFILLSVFFLWLIWVIKKRS